MDDLLQAALKVVQPSAKREGFATIPDVTWDDIGALSDVRDELKMAILVSQDILHVLLDSKCLVISCLETTKTIHEKLSSSKV